MKTLLLVMLVMGAADLLLCGTLLAVVMVQYRRVRHTAAAHGQVLPAATGQFAFLGGMAVAGLALLGWAFLSLLARM